MGNIKDLFRSFCRFLIIFIYFIIGFAESAAEGSSLVAVSRGYSLVPVHRLLTAVTSLVGDHGL